MVRIVPLIWTRLCKSGELLQFSEEIFVNVGPLITFEHETSEDQKAVKSLSNSSNPRII